MASTTTRFQYNETLLHQGKYGQWFHASLSAEARSWLNRKQCPACFTTPIASNKPCRCQDRVYDWSAWVNPESMAWVRQAACKGADLEIFFPTNVALYNDRSAAWRRYCGCCPVSGACILFAVDSKTTDGVWGGKYRRPSHRAPSTNPMGTGKPGRPRKAVEPP